MSEYRIDEGKKVGKNKIVEKKGKQGMRDNM